MSVQDLTDALDRLSENRKCLIVVDNLLYTPEWDTIIQEFCKIKKAKSWTIVITTRQKDIAEHCCNNPGCIHELNILGAEEARELFIKTVMKKTHIQSNSFDIMLCISTTVLKLASKRYSLEYFVGKKYENLKDLPAVHIFLWEG